MPLSPAHLRKWADELEAEEKAELDAAERKRIEELAAKPSLESEEIEWLRKMRAGLDEEDKADAEKAKAEEEAKTKAKAEEDAKGNTDDAGTATDDQKAKTRPGRKNGQAYGWWVDDDGKVFRLDTARIYSGEDEPDEVEIAEAPAA